MHWKVGGHLLWHSESLHSNLEDQNLTTSNKLTTRKLPSPSVYTLGLPGARKSNNAERVEASILTIIFRFRVAAGLEKPSSNSLLPHSIATKRSKSSKRLEVYRDFRRGDPFPAYEVTQPEWWCIKLPPQGQ